MARQPRKTPNAPRAVTAAATRARVGDKRALTRLTTGGVPWQEEAWGFYDENPEVKFVTMWAGNLLARVRLYVAVVPEGSEGDTPIDVADENGPGPAAAQLARDCLARLVPRDGGQAALLGPAAMNMDIAGEFWLVGRIEQPNEPATPGMPITPDQVAPEPTTPTWWEVRSVSEVQRQEARITVKGSEGGTGTELRDGEEVIRVYRRHPRYTDQADSHVRGVLSECRALQVFSQQKVAESLSRHNAGILLVPNELSFGPAEPADPEDGQEAQTDPFLEDLAGALTDPIADPSSPASVVPFVIRGQMAALAGVRHLPLSRVSDGTLDTRIDATVQRLARGLDAPVEVVMGHQQTTFANADQVDEDAFTDHLESRLLTLLDAFTFGYLRPELAAAGGYPEAWLDRTFVWYDASAIVRPPDKSGTAVQAWQDGLISDEARLAYQGFAEDDLADPVDRLVRLALTKGALDPMLTTALLAMLAGAPAIDATSSEPAPAPEPAPAELPAEPAPDAVAASAMLRQLLQTMLRAGPRPRVPRA